MDRKNQVRKPQLSRRDVLKLTGLGVGAFLARPFDYLFQLPQFPQAERLGRVTVGRVDIKARPDPESQTVGVLYEDAVLPWVREVTGLRPA